MKLVVVFSVQVLICVAQYSHLEDTDLMFPDFQIFYSPLDSVETSKYVTKNIDNCTCREFKDKLVCFGNKCVNFPTSIKVDSSFFKIQLSAIEVLRKNDFRNLFNITALEIEGNSKLKQIEEGVFLNMSRLINLTITSNMELKYLEKKVFEGLNNLEILCFSKSGFLRIADITRACSPKYLQKINVLSLSEFSFDTIYFDDFYPMNGSSLQQLFIILCQIETIEFDCLKPLRNLTQLRLGQNLFNRTTLTKFINRTLELGINLQRLNLYQSGLRRKSPIELLQIVGHSNISFLVFAGNNFNTIDNHWFPYMPRLILLDFRFCSIFQIDDDAFKPLPNLQWLLLKGNKFTTIPNALTVPKQLIVVDLSKNGGDGLDQSASYFFIPPNIFNNNMTNLGHLMISYNNIGSITKSTFAGLTTLICLILKNASLSYIENGSFMYMRTMTHLELTNNPLLTLNADIFLGLNNLQYLLLGGCAIQNLTGKTSLFQHVYNLISLKLDNNNLQAIATNQLTNLSLLNELQLSDNKLLSWNKRIFPSNISVLYFNRNKLISVTIPMLEDWKNIEYLYLQDNPFWCDCTLNVAANWIKYNKMKVIINKYVDEVALCIAPEKWRTKSIVTFIKHLRYNPEECIVLEITGIIFGSVFLILLVILIALGYWYRWHLRYWIFLWRLSYTRILKRTNHLDNTVYEYDVFVSHSTVDGDWITQLVERLEPALHVCVFERDFPAGATISQAALQAMLASRITLLVLSDAFVSSRWCRWETQLAQCHQLFLRDHDTLLLVRLEPIKQPTPTLRYLMNTRIYLDWPKDANKQEEFWKKLKTVLSRPKNTCDK